MRLLALSAFMMAAAVSSVTSKAEEPACVDLSPAPATDFEGMHGVLRIHPGGQLSLRRDSAPSQTVFSSGPDGRTVVSGNKFPMTCRNNLYFSGRKLTRNNGSWSTDQLFEIDTQKEGYVQSAGITDDGRTFVTLLAKKAYIFDVHTKKGRYVSVNFPADTAPPSFDFGADRQTIFWEKRDNQASPAQVTIYRLSLSNGKIEKKSFQTDEETDWSTGWPKVRELLPGAKSKTYRESTCGVTGAWKSNDYSVPSNTTAARLSADQKVVYTANKEGAIWAQNTADQRGKKLEVKNGSVQAVIPFPSGRGFWYQNLANEWYSVDPATGREEYSGRGQAVVHPSHDKLATADDPKQSGILFYGPKFCPQATYQFENPNNCAECSKSQDPLSAVGLNQGSSPVKVSKQLISRSLCSLSGSDPGWKKETEVKPGEVISIEKAKKILWRMQKPGGYERQRDLPILMSVLASPVAGTLWAEFYSVLPNLYRTDREAYNYLSTQGMQAWMKHQQASGGAMMFDDASLKNANCRSAEEDRIVAGAAKQCLLDAVAAGQEGMDCASMMGLYKLLPESDISQLVESAMKISIDSYRKYEPEKRTEKDEDLIPVARAVIRSVLTGKRIPVAKVILKETDEGIQPVVISSYSPTFGPKVSSDQMFAFPQLSRTELAPIKFPKESSGVDQVQSEYSWWVANQKFTAKVTAKRKSLAHLIPNVDRVDYNAQRVNGVRTGAVVVNDASAAGEYIEYLVDQGYRFDPKKRDIASDEWLKEKISSGELSFLVRDSDQPSSGTLRLYEKDLGGGKKNVVAVLAPEGRMMTGDSPVAAKQLPELLKARKAKSSRQLFVFSRYSSSNRKQLSESVVTAGNPAAVYIGINSAFVSSFTNLPNAIKLLGAGSASNNFGAQADFALFTGFLQERQFREMEKSNTTIAGSYYGGGSEDTDQNFILTPRAPTYYGAVIRPLERVETSVVVTPGAPR